MYEHIDLPKDPIDPKYIQSFNINGDINVSNNNNEIQNALTFFEEYGFVIFNNVYSEQECISTRSAMWEVMEKEYSGLNRNDINTWDMFKSTGKYGMSMRGPCFHPTLIANRCNKNLISILKELTSEDVMVSHDRYTIFRATLQQSTQQENQENQENQEEMKDYSQYKTGEKNIHLDLNPWVI